MAGEGRNLLGSYYGNDHITHEQLEELGLKVVTKDGDQVSTDDTQGKVFRIEDPEEPSGYLVGGMETTGSHTVLSYLQRA